MKEPRLSETLKELRYSLRLNQKEMALKLGMGEKMYQLYESGKYDEIGTDSVKRKKLFDKINDVKNKIAAPITSASDVSIPIALQNKETEWQVQKLNEYVIDLQKQLLEAKDTIRNLEHHISKMENQLPAQKRRAVAVAIHSKKN